MQVLSAVDQVAEHLREELRRGRWKTTLPGGHQLAKEFGVNHKTVEAAVRQLEAEGKVQGCGPGRRKKITESQGVVHRSLRVGLFLYHDAYKQIEHLGRIEHELKEAGHMVIVPPQGLQSLKHDVKKVAKVVKEHPVDAWIVFAGSRDVLKWFAARDEPCFAVFGRRGGLPIAATGPDKAPAYRAVVKRFVELGHQRIVLLSQKPELETRMAYADIAFLEELEKHGHTTSNYHLPRWEGNQEALQRILTSLFSVTPPTALLVDESRVFTAVLQFAGRRKLLVPEDLSLVCTDPDPTFQWCNPPVSHIAWDRTPHIRRVLNWVSAIKRGSIDQRQDLLDAEFVKGGTIGPVPTDS